MIEINEFGIYINESPIFIENYEYCTYVYDLFEFAYLSTGELIFVDSNYNIKLVSNLNL